jgi:hypothetical protein
MQTFLTRKFDDELLPRRCDQLAASRHDIALILDDRVGQLPLITVCSLERQSVLKVVECAASSFLGVVLLGRCKLWQSSRRKE